MIKDSTDKDIKKIKNLSPNYIRIIFACCFYIIVKNKVLFLERIAIIAISACILWLLIDYFFDLYKKHSYFSLIPASFDIIVSMALIYITGSGNSMVTVFIISAVAASALLADSRGFFQSYFIIVLSILLYISMVVLVSLGIIPSINLLDFSQTNLLFEPILSILFFIIYLFGIFYGIRNIRIVQLNLEKEINIYAESANHEREKSEKLLLNILPKEIAEELKKSEKSSPKLFQSVTVMFTDFAGFTDIANTLEPKELVTELDHCFSFFDSVSQKNQLEKIKTIGDSYMTCGGIPQTNQTHPVDSVLAALEIQSFMYQMKEMKKKQNLPYWELRIGINTGPLIAAVIGDMKFSYDVFGDTVNTASRMESSGEVDKINISSTTYELVNTFFDCEYRGKIPAKNKGLIDMYFVSGIKKELSVNGERKIPNELFFEKYKEISIIKKSPA